MIPMLFFQNHTGAVSRPDRVFGSSTLDVRVKWSAVSGMSSLPCHFQPRGQQPFANEVGAIYSESASCWIDVDVLPSGGEILTGDHIVVTPGGATWDVVDASKIEQGGIDRLYKLTLRKVNSA